MEQFTLRAARAQRNMSMREMAEKMGVTTSQVSLWELGKCDMSTAQFCKFCEIVGMQRSDIFLPVSSNLIHNQEGEE